MLIVDILQIIGTAAFAVTGVLAGIKNRLDWFGIFVLATMTASGGGLIRDIIIRRDVPVFFSEPKYLITILVSIGIGVLMGCFLLRSFTLLQTFDAIGLGVFTVLAAYKCIELGMPVIGVVFIAVVTGIGGGILRDVFVSQVPTILKSEIYALASIIGALCFYFLYSLIDTTLNIYLCIFIIFAIRMVTLRFKINLPVIDLKCDVNVS